MNPDLYRQFCTYKELYDNFNAEWEKKERDFSEYMKYTSMHTEYCNKLRDDIAELNRQCEEAEQESEETKALFAQLLIKYIKAIAELKKVSNEEEKKDTPKTRKRSRSYSDLKRDDMRSIKRHRPETKYTDDTLLDIFKKLKTIEDIIRLEDLSYRELNTYMTNPVFVRLYDTIPALKELNAMIGITDIKQNIMKNIIYLAIDGTIKCNLCHTKIFGPPGVGKTHFAKILGRVYHSMGFLNT